MATNDSKTAASPKVRKALSLFYALPVIAVLGLCGYVLWQRATHQGPPAREISSKPFVTIAIGGVTASLFGQGDYLRASGDDMFIEFRDARNNLVDVGNVTYEMNLKMPDMVMHSMGKVLRTGTPGQYRTTIEPQMAGNWTARLSFTGPRGTAEVSFPTIVK